MTVKVDNIFGRAIHAEGQKRTEKQPEAFAELLTAYETKFKGKIDAAEQKAVGFEKEAEGLYAAADGLDAEATKLKKEAMKLKGEPRQAKLAEANAKSSAADDKRVAAEEKIEDAGDARAQLGYTTCRVSGAAGQKLLFDSEGGGLDAKKPKQALEAFENSDAGHAVASVKNATLWEVGFAYGTHEPMQAVLSDLPKDKKVTFNVICSPSSHYGSDESWEQMQNPTPTPGSKRANFESNARTNQYEARVLYQGPGDSYPRELQKVSFGIKDPNKPEYASMSPDMSVDLSQLKGGKLILEGWCTASAGVGGYCETRQTVIKLPE